MFRCIMNHFIRVDIVWSYNLMGGLSEDIDHPLDHWHMDTVYQTFCRYIKAKHNFKLDYNAVKFNQEMESIKSSLPSIYYVTYCLFYFDNLYAMLGASFSSINYITDIELGVTSLGDLEAILIRTI